MRSKAPLYTKIWYYSCRDNNNVGPTRVKSNVEGLKSKYKINRRSAVICGPAEESYNRREYGPATWAEGRKPSDYSIQLQAAKAERLLRQYRREKILPLL